MLPGSLAVMAKPKITANQSTVFEAIAALGTTHLVSLLAPGEASELGLQDEAALCASQGMRFINFPIEDMTLPSNLESYVAFTTDLHRNVSQGNQVVVHCRAGIGRSGITACAVLMHEGIPAGESIDAVTQARGVQIPDTDEQRRFIHQLEPLIRF